MLQKEFVPPQESSELKELGFNEPCIAWFAETKELQIAPETYRKWTHKPCDNSNIVKVFNPDCFTAPIFSQAFRFFRKMGLDQKIERESEGLHIGFYWNGVVWEQAGAGSYEEAELACLKKLIEIVKGGNNEHR